jgi:hypothetical protein
MFIKHRGVHLARRTHLTDPRIRSARSEHTAEGRPLCGRISHWTATVGGVRLTPMSDTKHTVGRALRFVASGGWTTEDPDVMAELLGHAERLARAVVHDPGAAAEVRDLAQEFLTRLELDRPD